METITKKTETLTVDVRFEDEDMKKPRFSIFNYFDPAIEPLLRPSFLVPRQTEFKCILTISDPDIRFLVAPSTTDQADIVWLDAQTGDVTVPPISFKSALLNQDRTQCTFIWFDAGPVNEPPVRYSSRFHAIVENTRTRHRGVIDPTIINKGPEDGQGGDNG